MDLDEFSDHQRATSDADERIADRLSELAAEHRGDVLGKEDDGR